MANGPGGPLQRPGVQHLEYRVLEVVCALRRKGGTLLRSVFNHNSRECLQ